MIRRGLLIKYIIEGDEITNTTARMAVSIGTGFKQLLDISTLTNIHTYRCNRKHSQSQLRNHILLELLSIQLNNAFCAAQSHGQRRHDHGKELVPHVAPFLQTIYEHQLVETTRSPQYHELAGYYTVRNFKLTISFTIW